MKIEFEVMGGADKYSRFQVFVNDECVGELNLKDEDLPRFSYQLLGEYKISKK